MDVEQRIHARMLRAVKEILSSLPAGVGLQARGAPSTVRRRAMVRNIDLAAKHYGLRQEIDAFLATADCASVAGLDDQHLQALSTWLSGVMDRLATAADHPDAPAAR
jgi:hypothetical protein